MPAVQTCLRGDLDVMHVHVFAQELINDSVEFVVGGQSDILKDKLCTMLIANHSRKTLPAISCLEGWEIAWALNTHSTTRTTAYSPGRAAGPAAPGLHCFRRRGMVCQPLKYVPGK